MPADLSRSAHAAAARAVLLRASTVALGLAVVSVVLAGLYGNYYVLAARGFHLPDVSPPAGQLALGFQVVTGLLVGWALVLNAATWPGVAARVLAAWVRWTGGHHTGLVAAGLAVMLAAAYGVFRLAANEESPYGTLAMLAEGKAYRPYQYRVLVPWMAAVLHDAGLPLRASFGLLEAVAALAAYGAFRFFLRPYIGRARTRAAAALFLFVPLTLNLATGYRYNAILFPWDTASVAFFTLGLALLERRAWGLYYPLFVVATFNRETTCFLVVCYVLAALGEERPRRIALHAAAQTALWVAIKGALYVRYAGNEILGRGDTGLFVNQLERSFGILFSVPGPVYLVLAMGGLWLVVLLLRRWIGDPRVGRLARFVPVFLVGMVGVGELMEVRIYSELLPLTTLAVFLIARNVVQALAEPATAAAVREAPALVLAPRSA